MLAWQIFYARRFIIQASGSSGGGNNNPPLANSPRAQHSSLEGGMDSSLLLNLSTPPTGTTANAAPAVKEQGSKVDEDKENFATPETPRSVSLPCVF